ncbi:diguanylate cyclase domain-containing protein [Thiopseudomonas acetoxidans]|uniref:Diguanylate cyclase n=1 Tax=Thiopseudomonas acetoxidans TaxID=3041622 RepID=A0ABT7SPR0_9GAMM|nr:diguanylate cyclase [Thiopseudomonas sp. CY1220]MDM7858174.1 diguanylate cyclase [Thiopseudomonas sp. CY1220]
MKKIILQYRYWPIPILLWAALVLGSFMWNRAQVEHKVFHLANDRAYFVFKMVESVRLWNTQHGGVYAPVDEVTPPNPYLIIPERDISTPSGKALTLINPAYMTRQLTGVVEALSGLRLNLTSLQPLNPNNQPDVWERVQLEKFEHKAQDVSEIIGQGRDASFRFIAPLHVEKLCLKCHEHQGYKLGDIRGGLSVSFPVEPLFLAETEQLRSIGLTHMLVWLILSMLTLVTLSRYRHQLLTLETAKIQTEKLVEQRTAELRTEVSERTQAEAQLRLFIESTGEGIIGMNGQGLCTLVNPEAIRLLGMHKAEELLGKSVHDVIHHSMADGQMHEFDDCPLYDTLRSGRIIHDDTDIFWRMDGSSFPVEYRSHPLFVEGRVLGAVVSFSDITERKKAEAQLLKLSSAVEHIPAAAIITDIDGVIEYVNPSFEAMSGYQAEEVIGKNPRIWQSGQTKPETYQQMWQALKCGHVWQGEVLNKAKNGQLFWEMARISPIKNEDGVVTHFVAVKEDITERKLQDKQIWHQAHHDSLTNLPNRELFIKELQKAIATAAQENTLLALLYIDLDGFKAVNDEYGHATGDELLVKAAKRLSACVRDTDNVARLGGDEFTVTLAGILERSAAQHVAKKIVHSLAQPFQLEHVSVSISASVGVALFPSDAQTPDELIDCADSAMYQAKQAGRNNFCCYKAN